MSIKDLLQKRKQLRRRQPVFRRQDSHKVKGISATYRKPRGLHSKQREKRGGHQASPSRGYGSPRAVRHLDFRTGLMPIVVSTIKDLAKLNKAKDAAVISSAVGAKKRIVIYEEAKKQGIAVLNWKDSESHIKKLKDDFEKRTAERKETQKKEAEKKKQKEEKKDKDIDAAVQKEEEKAGSEEMKEKQKKELDRLLAKRE